MKQEEEFFDDEVLRALDFYELILRSTNPNLKPEDFIEKLLDDELKAKIKSKKLKYQFEDLYYFFKIFPPKKNTQDAKIQVLKKLKVIDYEVLNEVEFEKALERAKIDKQLNKKVILKALWKEAIKQTGSKNAEYYIFNSPKERKVYAILYHDESSVKSLKHALSGNFNKVTTKDIPIRHEMAFCSL